MGVNVTAMNYIGKYVQNAEEYLIEKGLLKKGQLAEEFDGDWGCADLGLDVQKVSYYSDAGYYIGFKVGLSDYVKFEKLKDKFFELTGDKAEFETFEHWW